MKLVSVVLPVYNVAPYIHRAIESLRSQTHSDFEAIFINDGSTDQSSNIIHQYAELDSRIRIFDRKNSGVADARNFGITQANGHYLYFFDPDDWIEPNLLFDNVRLAEEHNSQIVVFGLRYMVEKDRLLKAQQFSEFAHYNSNQLFAANFASLLARGTSLAWSPWNKIYSREWIERIKAKFPRQRVSEDAIFNMITYRHVDSVTLSPNIYYNYRFNRPGGALHSINLDYFESIKARIRELKRLFSDWGISSNGQINAEIINLMYSSYTKTAQYAIHNGGLRTFNESSRRQGYAPYMDSELLNEALPSFKYRLKHHVVKNPALIYALQKVR